VRQIFNPCGLGLPLFLVKIFDSSTTSNL